jgi:hypothetical protein
MVLQQPPPAAPSSGSGSAGGSGASSASGSGSGGGGGASFLSAPSAPSASHGGQLSDFYRTQARSLLHALAEPRNVALRRAFLCGELAPGALAVGGSETLCPPEDHAHGLRVLREERVRADLTRAAESAAIYMAHPGTACPECRARGGCEGRQKGGSSGAQKDIRKAEIWGTSAGDKEESTIALRCTLCGWKGEVEASSLA